MLGITTHRWSAVCLFLILSSANLPLITKVEDKLCVIVEIIAECPDLGVSQLSTSLAATKAAVGIGEVGSG